MYEKTILILILAVGLLLPQLVQAQGTLYLSNLAQTSISNGVVGSDSWLAQGFLTGTNSSGYVLNSVQLLMDAASGSPSGFTVSIYSNSGNSAFDPPGNNLGSLNGSTNPSVGGLFTYTTSGIMLSPSTFYFVLLTAVTPVASGAYNWSATTSETFVQNPADPWMLENVHFSSSDGANWKYSRQYLFQFAVYATAVPEPSTYALLGLGLAILSFRRRRQAK